MKTDHDIEQLLMSEEKLVMSSHEKASIKVALMSHAASTLKHETRAVRTSWMVWGFRGSVSLASLFIVFAGTAYASQDSLPGETLYTMKVHVVEEMVAFTKITADERVAYDIRLMENRLHEIKEVAKQGVTTPHVDMAVFTDQIEEHVRDVTTVLAEAESEHITHEDRINVFAKLSGVTQAQARIAKGAPELEEVSQVLEETQEFTAQAMTAAVDDFIEDESAEVVNEYLSDQITDVGEYVNASTTNELLRDTAERHLYNVDEALSEGDITEAIVSILQAQEVATVEEYIEESDEYVEVQPDESD